MTRENAMIREGTMHKGLQRETALRAKSARQRQRRPILKEKREDISFFRKLIYFYNAPMIIFFTNCVSTASGLPHADVAHVVSW